MTRHPCALAACLVALAAPPASADLLASARAWYGPVSLHLKEITPAATEGSLPSIETLVEQDYTLQGVALRGGFNGTFIEAQYAESAAEEDATVVDFSHREWALLFGSFGEEGGEIYGGWRSAENRFRIPAAGPGGDRYHSGGFFGGARGATPTGIPLTEFVLGGEFTWSGATWTRDDGLPTETSTPGLSIHTRVELGLRVRFRQYAGVAALFSFQGYLNELDPDGSSDFSEDAASARIEGFLGF